MVTVEDEQYVAFLTALTASTDPTVRDQAADTLARFVAKFNPQEPRLITGQWTAGAAGTPATHTVTTGQKPTPQSRQAARVQAQQVHAQAQAQATRARQTAHQQAADAKTQSHQQITQAAAAIASARSNAGKNSNSAAAVAATRKALGIPSGKKFKQLPPAKQHAANQIVTATRQLAGVHTQQAQANAELNAINQALKGKNLQPATVAWLQGQRAKVQAHQTALAAQAKTAQHSLAAGRKAWHGR